MTYYIGEIVFLKDISLNNKQIIARKNKINQTIDLNEIILKKCSKKTINLLVKIIKNDNIKQINENKTIYKKFFFDICTILENTLKQEKEDIFKQPIVFEIVKNQYDVFYAKEIYTGLLFPISFKIDYIDFLITEEKFTDKLKFEPKIDLMKRGRFESFNSILNYYLNTSKKIEFPGFLSVENCIINQKICNQKELDDYLNQFKKVFKKNKILKTLKNLDNLNVIKPNTIFQDNKKTDLLNQSKETLCMENIDYLLSQLKTKKPNEYQFLNQKYLELLKDPNLIFTKLAYLEGEIEFYYYLGNFNANDILKSLINLRNEYFINILNNNSKLTDLTFNKINKLTEIFLKVKDNYNLLDQREVLKNIAFLYLMEVYENKNTITIEELENSYFSKYLKTIIIWIKALQENNLITCELLYIDDNLTCENVFEIIKSIQFNKFDQKEFFKILKYNL